MSVSRRHFLQSSTIVSATIAATGIASFPSQAPAKPLGPPKIDYGLFSERAVKVMQLANQESQGFYHEYVGSEHLLMAIACEAEQCLETKENGSSKESWLDGLGLTHEDLCCVTSHMVPEGEPYVMMGKLPQSKNLVSIIEKAMSIAKELDDDHVEPEHLMLGIADMLDAKACDVLNEMWFERGACRQVALASLKARKKVS